MKHENFPAFILRIGDFLWFEGTNFCVTRWLKFLLGTSFCDSVTQPWAAHEYYRTVHWESRSLYQQILLCLTNPLIYQLISQLRRSVIPIEMGIPGPVTLELTSRWLIDFYKYIQKNPITIIENRWEKCGIVDTLANGAHSLNCCTLDIFCALHIVSFLIQKTAFRFFWDLYVNGSQQEHRR